MLTYADVCGTGSEQTQEASGHDTNYTKKTDKLRKKREPERERAETGEGGIGIGTYADVC
jgi:hypothetical protein